MFFSLSYTLSLFFFEFPVYFICVVVPSFESSSKVVKKKKGIMSRKVSKEGQRGTLRTREKGKKKGKRRSST